MEYKWKFAIGTTSRIPGNSAAHYFICDVDRKKIPAKLLHFITNECANSAIQKSPHGFHIYTDKKMSFRQLCSKLVELGADKRWVSIGKKRGYLFLADYKPFRPTWKVERMVLRWRDEGHRMN